MGSLALSLFTHSPEAARDFVGGAAAYHGRMLVIDRTNHKESTGHGSPLPVLVHGGPGRAGASAFAGHAVAVPLHVSATSQAPALPRQTWADETGVQAPLLLPPAATEHAWQSLGLPPPHALAQHTPSTQNPEEH